MFLSLQDSYLGKNIYTVWNILETSKITKLNNKW